MFLYLLSRRYSLRFSAGSGTQDVFISIQIYFDDSLSRFIVGGAKVTKKCNRFWQLDPKMYHQLKVCFLLYGGYILLWWLKIFGPREVFDL